MKKILIIPLLLLIMLLLLTMPAMAEPISFATISELGTSQVLQFANPALGQAVNYAKCLMQSGITCVANMGQSYVTGKISGEAMKKLQEISPETLEVLAQYNKIQGMVEQGMSLVETLGTNYEGEITKGRVEVEGETEVGGLIGKDMSADVVKVSNVDIIFSEGDERVISFNDEGSLSIKQGTGRYEEYKNIQKGGHISLDSWGEIVRAEFITGDDQEETRFFFGVNAITVPPNTEVEYKQGKFIAISGDNKKIGIVSVTAPNKGGFTEDLGEITNVEGTLYIHGSYLSGTHVKGEGFEIRSAKADGLAEFSLKKGKVSYIGGDVISNIYGIEHQTMSASDLHFYYDGTEDDKSGLNFFSYHEDKYYFSGYYFSVKMNQKNDLFPNLELSKDRPLEFKMVGGYIEIGDNTNNRHQFDGTDKELKEADVFILGAGEFQVTNGRISLVGANKPTKEGRGFIGAYETAGGEPHNIALRQQGDTTVYLNKNKLFDTGGEEVLCVYECESTGTLSKKPEKVGKKISVIVANTDNPRVSQNIQRKSGADTVNVFNPENYDNLMDTDTSMLAITGHHNTGSEEVWGDNRGDSLLITKLPYNPNVQVVGFSSCHTTPNPKYLLEGGVRGALYTFTAEDCVYSLEENFPNVRVVVGYETRAPIYDPPIEQIFSKQGKGILEKRGYKAFGDFAINTARQQKGFRGSETNSEGDWTYDNGDEDWNYRVSFYMKGEDGKWRFYSREHPKGVDILSKTEYAALLAKQMTTQ